VSMCLNSPPNSADHLAAKVFVGVTSRPPVIQGLFVAAHVKAVLGGLSLATFRINAPKRTISPATCPYRAQATSRTTSSATHEGRYTRSQSEPA